MNSHGVSVLLKHYVTGFQDGSINLRPNWNIIRETPTTANIDSDQGLGTMVTPEAMVMIGVCMTSTPGAVPANNELPFVFDAATRSSA